MPFQQMQTLRSHQLPLDQMRGRKKHNEGKAKAEIYAHLEQHLGALQTQLQLAVRMKANTAPLPSSTALLAFIRPSLCCSLVPQSPVSLSPHSVSPCLPQEYDIASELEENVRSVQAEVAAYKRQVDTSLLVSPLF